MNHFSTWQDQDGFTIQELLVTLVVGSILVSLSFSLFLFASKMYGSWQRKVDVQMSVTHALNLMVLDVLQSKLIPEVSDTALELIIKSGRSVRYHFGSSVIRRNEILIGQPRGIRSEERRV